MAATAGTVPSAAQAAENPADGDERIVASLNFDDETVGDASAVTKSWADYTGDITYAEGRTGKAIQLDGYGLRLNQKNVGAEYTVSMWMKHDSVLAENQQILFLGFDQRLALLLLEHVRSSGETTLRRTHEEIARDLGSAREVVTRMLRRFAEEGLVELRRGAVEVKDLRGLERIAGEA